MLLDNDVVTNGQAKTRALAGGFRGEKGIEYLLLHLGRNARSVVTYPDLHPVAEVFGRGRKGRLVIAVVRLRFAFGRRLNPFEIKLRRTRVISCGKQST
jgi:hypothetical protein